MSIEQIIGHHFKQPRLLEEALTHPSRAQTSSKGKAYNYQRLEFLGDSVLGLAVAELLYALYPEEDEGSLAKRHAALVRSETVAEVARKLGLGAHMRVHASESDNVREITSNLEDICESLLGALYLDAGFAFARDFVRTYWEPLARAMSAPPKDAKTTLQEWAQGRGLPLPAYQVRETTGPAHAPEFTVSVLVEGYEPAMAKALSKRQAEQLAAKALLERLGE